MAAPSHYSRLKPEPIEVIEAWGLGFHMGNALKYLARAAHKSDEVKDLRKLIWYVERHIQLLEAKQKATPVPAPAAQV